MDMMDNLNNVHQEVQRQLGGGGPLVIDYTILSMAIQTLAVLMVVEILRHKVDHAAEHGRPFFGIVLNVVYRELSTLGIVEAVVFVIMHYATIEDMTRERVFAEIHFLLFFVATFNAVMATILYLLTDVAAKRKWLNVEDLNIDNYLAVRNEFQAVNDELNAVKLDISRRLLAVDRGSTNESDVLTKISNSLLLEIGHGKLMGRYRRLLVQVRFHELRVHFIELNGLHPKFRVSDYLKLCLHDVFEHFVEISRFAWLAMVFFATSILFFMNIIIDITQSIQSTEVNIFINTIYLGSAVVFLLVSILISRKMKSIFFRIMDDGTWLIEGGGVKKNDPGSITNFRQSIYIQPTLREISHENQLQYFWFDNPRYIIAAAQFMQFGFAIIFSILLVFGEFISKEDNEYSLNIHWVVYISVPLFFYLCFTWLWSQIIIQYTQCTSIGKMVNMKNLVATESKLELTIAQREREEEIDHFEATKSFPKSEFFAPSLKHSKNGINDYSVTTPKKNTSWKSKRVSLSSLDSYTSKSDRLLMLSDLVKKDTKDLPPLRQSSMKGMKSMASRYLGDTAQTDDENSSSTGAEQRREIMSDCLQSSASNSQNSEKGERVRFAPTGDGNFNSKGDEQPREAIPDRIQSSESNHQNLREGGIISLIGNIDDYSTNTGQQRNSNNSIEVNSKTVFEFSDSVPDSAPPTDSDATGIKQQEEVELPTVMEAITSTTENRTLSIVNMKERFSEPEMRKGTLTTDDFNEDIMAVPFTDKLRKFVCSFRYRVISVVLTIVAFYILTWHMEQIFIDTCTIPDNQNHTLYILDRRTGFWVEVAFLSFFIVEASYLLFLGLTLNLRIFVAGVFDFLLSCISLSLFLWAEAERCCDCTNEATNTYLENNHRLLGPSSTTDTSDTCEIDCCPPFASRLCGGVGIIEPFVSIIALRIFKYILGDIFCKFYQKWKSPSEPPSNTIMFSSFSYSSEDSHTSDIASGYNYDFNKEVGKISDLWVKAVAKHPEIVENYGIFSGELLEVMLGIKMLPTRDENGLEEKDELDVKPQECDVSPLNVQSVITEGKTMNTVNSRMSVLNRDPSTSNFRLSMIRAPSAANLRMSMARAPSTANLRMSMARAPSTANLRMSMARKGSEFNIGLDEAEEFAYPSSALIRSMRRCQCKLLPLIDKWTTVDIVLTKHEIVWFDATKLSVLSGESDAQVRETIRKAIKDTKGGKGLPLCDMAIGRTILGRMSVADVNKVNIQRRHATEITLKQNRSHYDEENRSTSDAFRREFWEDHDNNNTINASTSSLSSHSRWLRITEDRLKLISAQNTVLLVRFLTDLCHEEALLNEDSLFGQANGALQWCQCIYHLKQKSPHFEDTHQDPLDIVEVVKR